MQQQREQAHLAVEACLIMEQCANSLVVVCEQYVALQQLQQQYQQLLAGQTSQQFEQLWQSQQASAITATTTTAAIAVCGNNS